MIRWWGAVAGLVLATTPALAQQCVPSATARGGGVFTLFVDSVAQQGQHTTERAALARAIGLASADSTRVVEYEQIYRVRVRGCPSGGIRVDTVTVTEVVTVVVTDTLRLTDTVTVVRVDTVVVPPVVTPPPPPPPPVDSTPPVVPPPPPSTGAAPAFAFTPARIATMQRMRADGHPIWRLYESNCAVTGTTAQRYSDTDGYYCLVVWMTTGDAGAAQRGIARLLTVAATPGDPNTVREEYGQHVLVTAGFWPAMSASQRTQAAATLTNWARWATGRTGVAYLGGFRTFDSDQSVATYFALALHDAFNRAVGLPGHWADSVSIPQGIERVPIGGLVATGANRATARNNVAFYAAQLAGGEWNESSEYNQGTLKLVLMGADALNQHHGRDLFPEITRTYRDIARAEAFAVTPDLRDGVVWWDSEHGHDFVGRLFKRITNHCIVQGVSKDATLHRTMMDLWARYGYTGYGSAEVWERCLPYYDPYAPVGAPAVGRHVATGRGHLTVRTDSSLVFVQMSNPAHEDHDWGTLSTVNVYDRGEWILDQPHGYGGVAMTAAAQNGPSYAGLAAMPTHGWTRVDSGATWVAITGTTSGGVYDGQTYWDPPPAFLTHATRTVLVAQVNGRPVIITRDSVRITAPSRLDRYQDAHRALLHARGFETFWHMPTSPTPTASGFQWSTPSGRRMALHTFGGGATAVADERALGWQVLNPGWHVRTAGGVVTWHVVADAGVAVSHSGDTITVGGQRFTVTSAGVR